MNVLHERRLRLSRKKTRLGTIDKGFHCLGINYLETQPLDGTNVTQISLGPVKKKQSEQSLSSMGGGGEQVRLQLVIRILCMNISFRANVTKCTRTS